jgi:hypothetical protein
MADIRNLVPGTPEFRAEVTRRYREELWHFGEAHRGRIAVDLVREIKKAKEKNDG